MGELLNEQNEQWYEDLHSQQHDNSGNGMRAKPSQESIGSSASFVSGNEGRPFQTPMGRDQDRKGVDLARGGLLLSPNG